MRRAGRGGGGQGRGAYLGNAPRVVLEDGEQTSNGKSIALLSAEKGHHCVRAGAVVQRPASVL